MVSATSHDVQNKADANIQSWYRSLWNDSFSKVWHYTGRLGAQQLLSRHTHVITGVNLIRWYSLLKLFSTAWGARWLMDTCCAKKNYKGHDSKERWLVWSNNVVFTVKLLLVVRFKQRGKVSGTDWILSSCLVHRGLLATGVSAWWKCKDVGEMQLARLLSGYFDMTEMSFSSCL